MRHESIILLPSSRWLPPEVQAFRKSHNLSFVPVTGHFEAAAQGRRDFPLEAALERATAKTGKRIVPALHPKPGWRWDMVRVEVASGGRLLFSCDGQHGEHRLPKTTARKPNQALGIVMTLAVKMQWRNPPSDAPDHERVRKNFQRLDELISALVPLPGKPFRRLRGTFIPLFQVSLHQDLSARMLGHSNGTAQSWMIDAANMTAMNTPQQMPMHGARDYACPASGDGRAAGIAGSVDRGPADGRKAEKFRPRCRITGK